MRHIIRKEFKELRRSGQFRFGGIVLLLLVGLSVVISSGYFRYVQQQHAAADQNERSLWLNQGEVNPHSAAHYGTYAFKPRYPLSLIDPGVDKYTGISVYLEAHSRNEAEHIAAADQTGLARFGDISPDFILLFIVPLFIILIGHDSWTKERQMGTLRLIKAQGLTGWQLAMGKWASNFIPIFCLTFLLFLLAGGLLSGLDQFGTFSWQALWVMFGIYLAYFAIFNTIVLFVSSRAGRADISLVILLGFWILSSLATPKAAGNYTNSLYPYPTRQEFQIAVEEDKKKGIDGHDPWNEASLKLKEETLKAYNVAKLEDLPFNFDALRMQKGEEHEALVYFKHYNSLKDIYQSQNEVYQRLSVLSPLLPTRFLSMAIASTDYNHHWDFTDAAEKYRIEMQKVLNTDFAENSRLGEWDYKADTSLWSKIAPFDYKPQPLRLIIAGQTNNLMAMSFWIVISFSALFLSVRKSPV